MTTPANGLAREGGQASSFDKNFRRPATLHLAESGILLELEQTDGEQREGEDMQMTLWPAARVFAEMMQSVSLNSSWRCMRVLELGAGCGACGITAAKLGASHTYLTDLLPLLPLLERNATRNDVANVVTVLPLLWGERSDVEAIGTVDAIIGSDVTAFVQDITKLAQTIEWLATPGHTQVWLAHEDRGGDRDNVLDAFAERFVVNELCSGAGNGKNVYVFQLILRPGLEPLTAPVDLTLIEHRGDATRAAITLAKRGDISLLKRLFADTA